MGGSDFGFGGMGGGFGNFGHGFGSSFGAGGGMMDRDFMNGGGMGAFGGGGFSSFQSFSSGNVPSSSVKTQTFIENGKRVTRTEKTTVDMQGRKNTVVTEEID